MLKPVTEKLAEMIMPLGAMTGGGRSVGATSVGFETDIKASGLVCERRQDAEYLESGCRVECVALPLEVAMVNSDEHSADEDCLGGARIATGSKR
ncbi:hypothetical protein SCE1572_11045 [Sorangium cellulosum So0157-2]|uniref:Uncharacterized protein n=1 Tax=Sorangium cellulosum So0157-2 TaxID=1254432 RepID=S4XPA6_SORCE|nr:hypothetical protein SCE1572_11045 [Sorangium cellulosum So0157-2]